MPLHVLALFLLPIISLAPPPTLSLFTVAPPPPALRSLLLLSPIQKDHTTLRYTLSIYPRTPPQRLDLLLHLGGRFSRVDRYSGGYSSATYRHIPCNFSVCIPLDSLACGYRYDRPPGPTCSNDTCEYFPENPLTGKVGLENALLDALGLPSTDGSSLGRVDVIPDFPFSRAKPDLLAQFPKGTSGLAALGFSNVSLPVQVTEAPSPPRCFALCLSGSRTASGVTFVGTAGPYNFIPGIDLSKGLTYTPILPNPPGDTVITYARRPAAEYYVGVTAVVVNGKAVPPNATLLAIDPESGYGGTLIGTVPPYTALRTSIYRGVAEAFEQEASTAFNLTGTQPVKPFSLCYSATYVAGTRAGPAVPAIDPVMQSEDVLRSVLGANSMVRIKRKETDVWCLGLVDGGAEARAAIAIGGHRMEDNLLRFDLKSMRLGFSSSVLLQGTACANFNFTTDGDGHLWAFFQTRINC
ncbi:probable aspartic proteinase GIP1 [Rhodamnia argentea]|uniref:Probable aspartic proteinase GIP1 n=1 Tax=Rhodamnia argentea TaxID=178133 RepID=A0ABM3HN03_9MYRT|nr:probable aspartic proteinase GIP1 [Rhodamnia argentea]